MPLDFTNNDFVPEKLQVDVEFERTKFDGKKYVINGNTGEYLGIVGSGFKCAPHHKFYQDVYDTIVDQLDDADTSGMTAKWTTVRNNAWVKADIHLPNMRSRVTSDKHSADIGSRIIALHGIDGSCSNMVWFGAIDFFCTNGMITGKYDSIKKKNTSRFSLDMFIKELKQNATSFYDNVGMFQTWAETDFSRLDVKDLIERIVRSDRKALKMWELYNKEAATRGRNKWALYSAFTNYASYADEKNGFKLRETGNDTAGETMWKREQEVAQWVDSAAFQMAA